MVIGLNLCPFAQRVFDAGTLRYVVSDAVQASALVVELAIELQTLVAAPRDKVETTLLIHPDALLDFADYNDFLGVAEALVRDLGLEGTVQVVGFHPEFRFEGVDATAVQNYTNRSPYPMLHLLREISVTEAGDPKALLEIPQRNTRTLEALGRTQILERLKKAGGELSYPPPAAKITDS